MSLECRECERDARGGHDVECSCHPHNVRMTQIEERLDSLEQELAALIYAIRGGAGRRV